MQEIQAKFGVVPVVTKMVLLNTQTHRNLKIQAGPSAKFGDNSRYVSVVLSEFPFLVPHYPIFFSKDPETGAFLCGALLGFDEGENLFLDDPAGLDSYRPLNLQRGPFYAVGSEVAIDFDSPRVGGETGTSLFTDTGESTPYLESIVAAMAELRHGMVMTGVFIDTLLKLKLIEPVKLSLEFDDGLTRELQGLYTIDKEALADLADADIVELFRRGYLHLIYLMIASLKQIRVMAQKKNRRLAE